MKKARTENDNGEQHSGPGDAPPTEMQEAAKPSIPATVPMTTDVEHGGLSGRDYEIPRVMLLQALTPDLSSYYPAVPGDMVSSVTKEKMPATFVPLFAFKYYAKFDSNRKFEWGTLNGNDPAVVAGLKWQTDAQGKRYCEVTEMINVLVMYENDTTVPYILTFKKSSIGAGKKFITMLRMRSTKNSHGVPLGDYYKNRYRTVTKELDGAKGKYWVTMIDSPKTQEEAVTPTDIQTTAAHLIHDYQPLISQMAMRTAEVEAATENNDLSNTPM